MKENFTMIVIKYLYHKRSKFSFINIWLSSLLEFEDSNR